MGKSRGFAGHKHSLATRAKISESMRRRKGPTAGLDGPSNLGGAVAKGGGSPIRTLAHALGSEAKRTAVSKVRSALMLRPNLTPDDRSISVSATRRTRRSGGRERYTDTLTISRGSDYKTGRVYDKYSRPKATKAKAATVRGGVSTTGGRSRGGVSVSSPRSRGL